ncbi:MAG: hypothetical protein J7K15_16280 [Deltaproteobacteria bacterium]|nr:hypothetical protein [Deltaproteobacteria bacterium]
MNWIHFGWISTNVWGTRRDYSCAVIIMPEVERALQMGSCKRYQAGGLVPGGEDIDGSS